MPILWCCCSIEPTKKSPHLRLPCNGWGRRCAIKYIEVVLFQNQALDIHPKRVQKNKCVHDGGTPYRTACSATTRRRVYSLAHGRIWHLYTWPHKHSFKTLAHVVRAQQLKKIRGFTAFAFYRSFIVFYRGMRIFASSFERGVSIFVRLCALACVCHAGIYLFPAFHIIHFCG